MSQIASKVRYRLPNILLSRRPAMPWSTHWALLSRMPRPPVKPLPMLHRPRLAGRHVQIARNADCSIAIEPLRAPGYAPPIANAPRREFAERLRLRMRKYGNEIWR
jgi:hypothetical protein